MTIDIDEIERIAKAGDPWGYAATPANILALIAEVRALREDAERYRWIASENQLVNVQLARLCALEGTKEELDAAIDQARGAK